RSHDHIPPSRARTLRAQARALFSLSLSLSLSLERARFVECCTHAVSAWCENVCTPVNSSNLESMPLLCAEPPSTALW
ncbi:MAG: hypothetical protein ACK55Z_32540, partial [bacterium]